MIPSIMCRRIEITAGFWLLMAAGYYFMDGAVVLLTVLSAVFHELAHYAALGFCGAKVGQVRLTAFGAEMQVENEMALSYGQEIFCAAAGPICNAILAVCCSCLSKYGELFLLWAGIHAAQAAFNLLPFEMSDGGRMLRALLCAVWGAERGERISSAVGFLCGAIIIVLSMWVVGKTGGNGFLLLGAIGLMLPLRKRYL